MTPKLAGCAALLFLTACASAPPPPAQAVSVQVAPREPSEASRPPAPAVAQGPRGEAGVLEQLLASTSKASPDRPKLLRRLAETYVAIEAAAQREGEKGEPVARAARQKAIEHYEALAAEHPSFCAGGDKGCGDAVLFYLAYEYEQARETAKAQATYRELIKSWPQSRYLPNAFLAFAEAFFEEGARDPSKLALAERAYEQVLRFPPPENQVAGYAHYKLAYVYFNKGDTAQALAEMTKAIEVSEQTPRSPPQLARQARRDLVPIYAAGGDPARAYDFLASRSGDKPGESDKLHALLAALAQAYADQGKEEAAAEVYADWLSRGAGARTCTVVKEMDALAARAPRAQRIAAASAPLMKARVECATAP